MVLLAGVRVLYCSGSWLIGLTCVLSVLCPETNYACALSEARVCTREACCFELFRAQMPPVIVAAWFRLLLVELVLQLHNSLPGATGC